MIGQTRASFHQPWLRRGALTLAMLVVNLLLPATTSTDGAEGRWWGLEGRLVSRALAALDARLRIPRQPAPVPTDLGNSCYDASLALLPGACLDSRTSSHLASLYAQDRDQPEPPDPAHRRAALRSPQPRRQPVDFALCKKIIPTHDQGMNAGVFRALKIFQPRRTFRLYLLILREQNSSAERLYHSFAFDSTAVSISRV